MHQIWVAAGMAIAVIAVGIPFAATILVSIASRREEAAHSLSRHAPGAVTQAARRLLAFRSERISAQPGWAEHDAGRWWQRSSSGPASSPQQPHLGREAGPGSSFRPSSSPQHSYLGREARPIGLALGAARRSVPAGKQFSEVRFGHARRSLPDSGQYSAGDQSQPGSIRTDQRQGAGV